MILKTKHSFHNLLKLEIKDSFFYTVATIITQLGNFLIIPLFWKVFTPTDYGVIAITEIIGVFLSVVLGLSLDQSITRFYYEWPEEEKSRRIGAIWILSWGSSLILGTLAIILFFFLNSILFPEVNFYPIIFLGLVNTILVSMTTVVLTTIRIKKMPKLFCGYRLSTFFLQIGLCVYYVLVLKKGLPGYFTALVISSFITSIGSFLLMSRFGTLCLRNAFIKESLCFSVPMIPSALISAGTSILDRFILKQFCSLEILGIYSLAMKFASLITVVQNSLKLSYGPFFMKNIHKENGQDVIYRMAGFYIYPLFFSGLFLSLFVDKIIILISQPLYFSIIEYVPYLVVITIVGALNVFYANGIILSNKTHLLIIPALVQFVTIFTGVILIPSFQIYGIIIAKAISIISFVGVSIFISNRVYKIKYNWRNLIIFSSLMILGIFLNVIFASKNMIHDTLLCIGIMVTFVGISYAIFLRDIRSARQQN